MPHAVFLDEKHFLLQPESAAQPNPSQEPDLDFMIERKIQPASQMDVLFACYAFVIPTLFLVIRHCYCKIHLWMTSKIKSPRC